MLPRTQLLAAAQQGRGLWADEGPSGETNASQGVCTPIPSIPGEFTHERAVLAPVQWKVPEPTGAPRTPTHSWHPFFVKPPQRTCEWPFPSAPCCLH